MEGCDAKKERGWIKSMNDCHRSVENVFAQLNDLEKVLDPFFLKDDKNAVSPEGIGVSQKPKSQITEHFDGLNISIIGISRKIVNIMQKID